MDNLWFRHRLCAVVTIFSLTAIHLLIAANGVAQDNLKTSAQSQRPKDPEKKAFEPKKWQKEIAKNSDSLYALFKPGNDGSGFSEIAAWQMGDPRGGPERIVQLQTALEKYPDSPFADDAALLLARSYFLYEANPEKAIAGLYGVIKKYPEGEWIAGDLVVRNKIARLLSPKSIGELTNTETGFGTIGVMPYMDYVSEHPNLTADEAKVCIAWIIFAAKLDKRYQEAEDLLREVIARYRDAGRTQADLKAGEELKNELIKKQLPRTERDASLLLIALLKREGNEAAADKAAEEYAQLYQGHPSIERLQGIVKNLGLLPPPKASSKPPRKP